MIVSAGRPWDGSGSQRTACVVSLPGGIVLSLDSPVTAPRSLMPHNSQFPPRLPRRVQCPASQMAASRLEAPPVLQPATWPELLFRREYDAW